MMLIYQRANRLQQATRTDAILCRYSLWSHSASCFNWMFLCPTNSISNSKTAFDIHYIRVIPVTKTDGITWLEYEPLSSN